MKIALKLAQRGRGKTSPNPMVGAVVVKNGKVIGKGYHEKAGLLHAEVKALNQAKNDSEGSTLYVTLEPCVHFGRTPPCVDKILRSGVKHVVIGMIDPNPLNNGKGAQTLMENGVKVEIGVLEEQCKKLNEVFIKYISKKLPFVTVKVAESLDGKIATKTGDSKWITSDKSRNYAHRIRAEYDAVAVGVNTVLRDNPKLTAWFSKKNPVRIIVDSQLSTPYDSNIFLSPGKVIIVTLAANPGQETQNRLNLSQKAQILKVKEKAGQINLKDMMKKLAQMEITNILVEGGGTLIGSLFDEGLVDRVLFFISPKIIGGKDSISSVMGEGITNVHKAARVKDLTVSRIGEDIVVKGYVK